MDALTLVLALKALQGGGGGSGTTNFNNLTNRPKYNGTTMTDQTNIPEVKTSTWDGKSTVTVASTGSATQEVKYITVDGVESKLPTSPVQDIKVNNTSVLSGGVANIPTASSDTLGVVKTNGSYGIVGGGGLLIISKATDEDIVAKSDAFKPLVPGNLNKSIMEGLGNYNGPSWSDAYKATARNTIGIKPETSYTVELSDGTTKVLKIYSELI